MTQRSRVDQTPRNGFRSQGIQQLHRPYADRRSTRLRRRGLIVEAIRLNVPAEEHPDLGFETALIRQQFTKVVILSADELLTKFESLRRSIQARASQGSESICRSGHMTRVFFRSSFTNPRIFLAASACCKGGSSAIKMSQVLPRKTNPSANASSRCVNASGAAFESMRVNNTLDEPSNPSRFNKGCSVSKDISGPAG